MFCQFLQIQIKYFLFKLIEELYLFITNDFVLSAIISFVICAFLYIFVFDKINNKSKNIIYYFIVIFFVILSLFNNKFAFIPTIFITCYIFLYTQLANQQSFETNSASNKVQSIIDRLQKQIDKRTEKKENYEIKSNFDLISNIPIIKKPKLWDLYSVIYQNIKDDDKKEKITYDTTNQFQDFFTQNKELENIDFAYTTFENIDFAYTTFENIDFAYTTFDNCNFFGSTFDKVKTKNICIKNSNLVNIDIKNIKMNMKNINIEDCICNQHKIYKIINKKYNKIIYSSSNGGVHATYEEIENDKIFYMKCLFQFYNNSDQTYKISTIQPQRTSWSMDVVLLQNQQDINILIRLLLYLRKNKDVEIDRYLSYITKKQDDFLNLHKWRCCSKYKFNHEKIKEDHLEWYQN